MICDIGSVRQASALHSRDEVGDGDEDRQSRAAAAMAHLPLMAGAYLAIQKRYWGVAYRPDKSNCRHDTESVWRTGRNGEERRTAPADTFEILTARHGDVHGI